MSDQPGSQAATSVADAATGASTPAKSKNADKNEAKRLAKLAKFAAKQAKLQVSGDAIKEKAKKKKEPKPEEPVEEDNTPPGEKKDTTRPLAASYNPKSVEAAWYAWWEKQGFFQPRMGEDGKPRPEGTYVVPIPPPNITGALHIGHALTCAIQDALVRWNRMLGKTVLYNPGCDHAGISAQAVVEKKLWMERKVTRHDLGREAFTEEVWKWRHLYGDRIYTQLKRLGASYDWERTRFTMDPPLCKAVNEAFVRLHDEGIIYRDMRLVNWCVHLNTTLSNLEVDNKELTGRTLLSVPGYAPDKKYEFGVIVSFAYEVEDSDERIVVATTRPETMLGDTAVAVHPDDERYKHLHGKFVRHPFVDRRIPIITDSVAVDMAFGTGAVKMTPAHDFNDYAVGKRHNLAFVNIMNDDGTLNEHAGSFAGMKRFDAREAVIAALQEKGLYVETKDNPMTVPLCSKSNDVIEPLLKPQWWVDCSKMAADAMEAVTKGELNIQPKYSEREWFRWLGNINDWCISRQLWWGHRVPAYFVKLEDEVADPNDGKYWISGRTLEEAEQKAAAKFAGRKYTLEQDEDVLDTWFSSGLWPFSIQGWPEKTPDFANFYPASLLETGWDIIFFWVARMVMLGIKLTGQVPFKEVFCHAIIRDAHGRKMSKSLGNVIDPISVIEGVSLEKLNASLLNSNLDPREVAKAQAGQKADYPNGIPECGTDALRFAMCAYTSTGRDINLDILRVEGYRKFCNKLWNVVRFAMMKLGDNFAPNPTADLTGDESLAERWILHKLNKAAADTNTALAEKNFTTATSALHSFWLYDLCDVFVEAIKPIVDDVSEENAKCRRSAQNTLYTCLEAGIKLLHPFMPFVTEELYQRLPRRPNDTVPTIMLASYPVAVDAYNCPSAETGFDTVFAIVRSIRSLMTQYNITANASVYVTAGTEELCTLVESQSRTIMTLSKGCKEVFTLRPSDPSPAGCALASLSEQCSIQLLVKGMVDIDAEVAKLENKLGKARTGLKTLQAKMSIDSYETKIPANVREANDAKAKNLDAEIEALAKSISDFLSLKN
ncbi:tRNA synthetases class I-domain-containing protein [Thamnocephalis sphaerospora]|uniref:Probable valine--tRNA ligase, cytoplasmic n=1 Tax=Thamnocephalis sphaerospora TaxID=78915 RepID=A0A4P9XU40_9FUNG|nr:tRNA synthetases class I-domain-containing protein [Thamnocephalis sphaerospora]|eukprot:RKP09452.1 tRNA synthetases class I-domain-containing protein [Thamnocephalis sphaerospora]